MTVLPAVINCHRRSAIRRAELLVNTAKMYFHRALTDSQCLGNDFVRASHVQASHDLLLAQRQGVESLQALPRLSWFQFTACNGTGFQCWIKCVCGHVMAAKQHHFQRTDDQCRIEPSRHDASHACAKEQANLCRGCLINNESGRGPRESLEQHSQIGHAHALVPVDHDHVWLESQDRSGSLSPIFCFIEASPPVDMSQERFQTFATFSFGINYCEFHVCPMSFDFDAIPV